MRTLTILGAAVLWVVFSVGSAAGWSIVQLTDNDYDDIRPQVSGSNVAWKGRSNSEFSIFYEDDIFLFDGAVRQLTNDSLLCCSDEFSLDGNRVAWTTLNQEKEFGSEVVYFDGQTIQQITDNDVSDGYPVLWNGGVAWLHGGGYPGTDREVFNFDGTSTQQLTNDNYKQYALAASGNYVCWATEEADYVNRAMRYDGQTTTELANIPPNLPFSQPFEKIQISEENVLLIISTSMSTSRVELCTPEGRETIDDIGIYLGSDISGSRVVYSSLYSSGSPPILEFYDGDQIIELSDSGSNPCISGSLIAWSVFDGNDYEIFLYNGTSIMQVTDNDFNDSNPQISESTLAWQHWDGNDWEVQMTTVPEPSGIVLFFMALLCFGIARWRCH